MSKPLKTVLCIVMIIALLGASAFAIYKAIRPYNPKRFIGLTYEQIVTRYGEFDVRRFKDSETGMYHAGGYEVRPERVGFFGTDPARYFMIHFDKNGVADRCSYELGGWGG